jgi:hypothetical protein
MTFLQTYWHGSKTPVDTFTFSGSQQGLHIGTLDHAKSFGPHLYAFKLYPSPRITHLKDTGEGWLLRAKRARKNQKDIISYLNRFEGIPPHLFDALTHAQRQSLDTVSDKDFLALIPCAQHSLLILRDNIIRQLSPQDTQRALQDHTLLQAAT